MVLILQDFKMACQVEVHVYTKHEEIRVTK